MKKALIGLVIVVLLLGIVACASAKSPVPMPTPSPTPYPVPAPSAPRGGIPAPTITQVPPPAITIPSQFDYGSVAPSTPDDRMIVRSGNVVIVVTDVIKARDSIAQLATSMGGYVVSSWVAGEADSMRANIAVRVPDEQFDSALISIRGLAVRVKSESTNSQDVTEEYVDLQSRLKNAEAAEAQYLALLDKATAVEDILKIYDNLSRVRGDIEQIKGRMQYLERTTSMSLITVNLEPSTTGGVLKAGWNVLEVLKSAVRGAVVVGQWLLTIVIWLLIFIPVWGTILGIIYWRIRKKRAGIKAA